MAAVSNFDTIFLINLNVYTISCKRDTSSDHSSKRDYANKNMLHRVSRWDNCDRLFADTPCDKFHCSDFEIKINKHFCLIFTYRFTTKNVKRNSYRTPLWLVISLSFHRDHSSFPIVCYVGLFNESYDFSVFFIKIGKILYFFF